MKKLFVYGLSIALVAGAASCKKSSKGKMDNEWKMSNMTMESTDTNSNGDVSSSSITIDGTTVTMVETDSNGDATTLTGTVATATWTIMKDGTWTRNLDMTLTSYSSGGVTADIDVKTVEVTSGTWDFMNGLSKEFKKNERVVFNTTATSSTETSTFGGVSSTDVNSATYAEGEMSEVMVITESKKKELMMSMDAANSNTNNPDGGTSTTTSSTSAMTVTLGQE